MLKGADQFSGRLNAQRDTWYKFAANFFSPNRGYKKCKAKMGSIRWAKENDYFLTFPRDF